MATSNLGRRFQSWLKEQQRPEDAWEPWEQAYGQQLTSSAQLRPRNKQGQAQSNAGSVASDEGVVAEKAPKAKKKKKKAYVPTEAERRTFATNYVAGRRVRILNREAEYDTVMVRDEQEEYQQWWNNGDLADMIDFDAALDCYRLKAQMAKKAG